MHYSGRFVFMDYFFWRGMKIAGEIVQPNKIQADCRHKISEMKKFSSSL